MKVGKITLHEPILIIDYFCYNTSNFQGPVGPVSLKSRGPTTIFRAYLHPWSLWEQNLFSEPFCKYCYNSKSSEKRFGLGLSKAVGGVIFLTEVPQIRLGQETTRLPLAPIGANGESTTNFRF